MIKWGDKFLYPWMSWIGFINSVWVRINDYVNYSCNNHVLGFIIFTINYSLFNILRLLLIGVFGIFYTIEWLVNNYVELLDDKINNMDDNIMGSILSIFGIVSVAPFTFTWGLPYIILSKTTNIFKEKDEDLIEVVVRCSDVIRDYHNEYKIKPTKSISKHNFRDENKG